MEHREVSRRSFLAGMGALALITAFAPASAHATTPAPTIEDFLATGLSPQAGAKAAVVYFSCTGTTKGAAKRIKKATGASITRIIPEIPYTEDDIDYTDKDSRVWEEHSSASSPAESTVRPAIANLKAIKKAVKKADVVYIGYPIWWGEAPHIMYTLIEKLSLKGKTVVPFCTSMASGLGKSDVNLQSHAITSKATVWKKGRNFYDIPSQKKVNAWLEKL